MTEPRTAQHQLQRLLYVLPMAARRGGASLVELAAALGIEVDALVLDIEEATARAYYLPAGDADSMQITLEGDRLQVFAGGHFGRPVRLTHAEALALGIGLRMLAAEVEEPERSRRSDLAALLEHALVAPPTLPAAAQVEEPPRVVGPRIERYGFDADAPLEDLEPPAPMMRETRPPASRPAARPDTLVLAVAGNGEPLDIELGEDSFRGLLADGVREHRRVLARYLRPGDVEPRERSLEPLRLVYANGRWYVLARTAGLEEVRVYRMDRVLDARLTEHTFEPGPFDASMFIDDGGRAYGAKDAPTARVRYSARVARWIGERAEGVAGEDGSLTVEHRVADADWLARHVLQYGADAEVVGPRELREHVARLARRLAASA